MAIGTNSVWPARMLSVLRIVAALVFMEHGMQKIFGFPAPQPMPFQLASIFGIAAILEFGGGALLAVGLFTRAVAFILAGEMAAAYFMVHAKQSFFPLVNKGELAVLYCFIFLLLVFAGGGPWSLDAAIRKSA